MSPQYLIVELVFGVVFVFVACNVQGITNSFQPAYLIYLWAVSFLLISISVYDIRHMIIPDGMLVALGLIVLAWQGFGLWGDWNALFAMFVAGPLVALPFFLLWLISSGRWMGFGDIKLSVVLGWMLGLFGGFSALVFGVWAGALISLAIIGIIHLRRGFGGQGRLVSLADHNARSAGLVSHRTGLTMKSEIPFGPFLVAGALFVLLTHVTLLNIVM